MRDVPSGWTRTTIGEIAKTQLGKMLSKKSKTGIGSRPYVRNKNVQWGRIDLTGVPEMDFTDAEFKKFRLDDGDLLVCEGGEVGRAAIWRGQIEECAFQKAIHRIRTSDLVLPEYLLHLLRHYSDTQFFDSYVTGSTIRHLPQEDLRILPVPLAPLDEQRRIVDAIEEQLSRLDDAESSLGRATARLASLRSGVLRECLDSDDWPQRPIVEIAEFVTDGDHRPPPRVATGIPHLSAKHVRDGRITTNGCTFVSEEGFEQTRRRYEPQPGDVIVTCVGTVGEVAVVPERLVFSADRNLAAIRVTDAVVPTFLSLALSSPRQQAILRAGSGSTAQPHLYLRDLRKVRVPVPPVHEQRQIVVQLEERLSGVEAMKRRIATGLDRSHALRRAILRDAFAGRLVDRATNTARALLPRNTDAVAVEALSSAQTVTAS